MTRTSTALKFTASKLNFNSWEFGKMVPLLTNRTCGFKSSKAIVSENGFFSL